MGNFRDDDRSKAMLNKSNNEVPEWAVNALGGYVRLTTRHDEYDDGAFLYTAGTAFRLAAIQPGGMALCEVLDDIGGLLDVPFSSLAPVE
jgi:hypothetical protein